MLDRSISIPKIRGYFNQKKVDDKILNKLFYYSLFDSSSFESDERLYPIGIVKEFKDEMRELLKGIFTRKQPEIYNFLRNPRSFDRFESKVIATDIFSRIILSKQLSSVGVDVELKKSDNCDLKVKNTNINIELKRICLWTNYSNYLTAFLDKANKEDSTDFVYVVACTHPFVIEKILEYNKIAIFNRYISNIVESHYVIEKLVGENIKFVIRYVDKNENDHSLSSLCTEIKQKINEFSSNER